LYRWRPGEEREEARIGVQGKEGRKEAVGV